MNRGCGRTKPSLGRRFVPGFLSPLSRDCIHPDDGKQYLVTYRDCCGAAPCGQCFCRGKDRETPVYRPQGNNDIIWCLGATSMEYHCSTSVLVGLAE